VRYLHRRQGLVFTVIASPKPRTSRAFALFTMAPPEPLSIALEDDNVRSETIDFHHPYTPYDIQLDFMQTVYSTLSRGSPGVPSVGILESPTGTGKSLSLICATLTWLRDEKRKRLEEGCVVEGDGWEDEPEWVVEAARARKRRELLRGKEELERRLQRARKRGREAKRRMVKAEGDGGKRRRVDGEGTNVGKEGGGEDEFLVEEYNSGEEGWGGAGKKERFGEGLSAETLALIEKLGMGGGKKDEDEELEMEDEIKIFYCSRTHSQLTQFINELRRVKMPPALPPADFEPPTDLSSMTEEFKHLTLGSRKNLCINPKVNHLSPTSLNERCLELQQTSTSSTSKCAFLPNKENQPLVSDFRDATLATIRDIEELGNLGKELGICPYYAARTAIMPAEIITLPYPLLLQKSAREALGIDLTGHVVVVDEAHNLMDAIAGIYGVSVSLEMLRKARVQLGEYVRRFGKKLGGKNRVYVAQVVRLVDSLRGYLEGRNLGKVSGISEKFGYTTDV
jgi:chromosome transmission fidelity protein 1